MSSLTKNISRIPVAGYLAKVIHDLFMIPVIRRDLNNEIASVRNEVHGLDNETNIRKNSLREEIARLNGVALGLQDEIAHLQRTAAAAGTQDELLRSHLDRVLAQLSECSSTLHELRPLPDGLRALRRVQLSLESRMGEFEDECLTEMRSRLDGFFSTHSGEWEGLREELSSLAPKLLAEIDSRLSGMRKELSPPAAPTQSYASREQHLALQHSFNHFRDHAEHFLQTIRSELLAEVDSRLAAQSRPAGDVIIPRIINPGKLLRFADGLRLNLGSGPIPLHDYLNVDSRELRDVDVLADVGNLPFGRDSVAEFFASHLLEHFKESALRQSLIPYWRGLLKPGGVFRIIVPDAEGMLKQYADSEISFDRLRLITFGGQDYDGNYHFTMFSRDGLRALLNESGFETGDYAAVARPNGDCLEMEIVATKTAKSGDSPS